MAYINLTLRHNDISRNYILTNADFLKEAWLAETFEDGSAKIIYQFKCRRFKRCFGELSRFLTPLGTVESVTGNDIDERTVDQLRDLLIDKKKPNMKRRRRASASNLTFLLHSLGLGNFRRSAYS